MRTINDFIDKLKVVAEELPEEYLMTLPWHDGLFVDLRSIQITFSKTKDHQLLDVLTLSHNGLHFVLDSEGNISQMVQRLLQVNGYDIVQPYNRREVAVKTKRFILPLVNISCSEK